MIIDDEVVGMTLEEAIEHFTAVASNGHDICARDHQYILNWLLELQAYRKLGINPSQK